MGITDITVNIKIKNLFTMTIESKTKTTLIKNYLQLAIIIVICRKTI